MLFISPVLSVAFMFGSSIINPSEILELVVDPSALASPAVSVNETPIQTGARIMRLIARSLFSSQASIFCGESKPARMFTLIRLGRIPENYETQDSWREESNFNMRCRKGPWLRVILTSSNIAADSPVTSCHDIWLRHNIVCKPFEVFRSS
jgi:hypothetical protein